MLRPLAVIVGIMLLIGFATCTVNHTVIHMNARGQPLDHPVGFITCPLCRQGTAFPQGPVYEFKCDACQKTFQARRNPVTDDIELKQD